MIARGGPLLRGSTRSVFAALLLGLTLAVPSPAAAGNREFEIKAALIEKLIRFVEWPEADATSDPGRPFVIMVLGVSPFDRLLDTLSGLIIADGRRIELRYTNDTAAIGLPDVLFICGSERSRLESLIERVARRPVLTIADTRGFGQRGVMVNLFNFADTVQFEVNLESLEAANLRIESRVLDLARLIRTPTARRVAR